MSHSWSLVFSLFILFDVILAYKPLFSLQYCYQRHVIFITLELFLLVDFLTGDTRKIFVSNIKTVD